MHGDEGDGEVADGRVHDGVRVGDDDEKESRRTGMPERRWRSGGDREERRCSKIWLRRVAAISGRCTLLLLTRDSGTTR